MIVFKDGADHYATVDVPLKWSVFAGGVSSRNIVAGVYGGNAIELYPSFSTTYIYKEFGGTEPIIGTSLYVKQNLTGTFEIKFTENAVSITHITVTLNSLGTVAAYKGATNGTLLATTGVGAFTTVNGSWFHVEIKVNVHDTTGYVEVRINQSQVLRFDGDTRLGGTGFVSGVLYYVTGGTQYFTIDHIHIWNTLGTVNNDWLGDVKIITQLITGDGVLSEFTRSSGAGTHASHVDEATPNSDTDYLSSSAPVTTELFTHASIVSAASVKDVAINAVVKKDDVGNYNLKAAIRSGGSNYEGAATHAAQSTYVNHQECFGLDPATAAAWVAADYSSSQVGFKHSS